MESLPGSHPIPDRSSFGSGTDHRDELKEKASHLTQTARGRAMGALDQQKEQVCSMLEKVAQNVEGDKVGGYVADFARRGSEYLKAHSADEIISTATAQLKGRPVAFIGASFLGGFAIARLFRR
jgi:hypothetical protein